MRQTIFSILFIVLIVATGFVWLRYVRTTSPAEQPVGTSAEENDRLNQYRQLKNFKPDISILQDPRFQALTRPGAAAATTTKGGRDNPFAPF